MAHINVVFSVSATRDLQSRHESYDSHPTVAMIPLTLDILDLTGYLFYLYFVIRYCIHVNLSKAAQSALFYSRPHFTFSVLIPIVCEFLP